MRFSAFMVLFGLLLNGCQMPVVEVRHLSLDSKFIVDGKSYDLKTQYDCHFEDIGWISERGPMWHIRDGENVVRINGKLADGHTFLLMPQEPDNYVSGSRFCPDHTLDINARLFIKVSDTQFESFDKTKTTSSAHTVQMIENKLSLNSSGFGIYTDKGGSNFHSPDPTKFYYTVTAAVFKNYEVNKRPELISLIKSKKINSLDKGITLPFLGETEYNPFNYGKFDEYKTVPKFALLPDADNWVFSGSEHQALRWQLMPMPPGKAIQRAGEPVWEHFLRWITYDGTKIEMPLIEWPRFFYDPINDRFIEFNSEQIELW